MMILAVLLTALLGFTTAASIVDSRVDHLVSRRSLAKRQNDEGNHNITIFHINDVHAHLDQFLKSGTDCTDPKKGCFGGYARVKDMVDHLRPHQENSLFLNIGDEFQGTLFFTFYGGTKIAETINQLGFDALVPGNHEFDRGDDYLAQFLQNLTFPVVCANIHTNNTALSKALVPYHIFEKHNLAVIGLTTATTPSISNPGAGTTFDDPIAVVQKTVDEIYATTNVTRVIAMTHIGYEVDMEMAQKTRGLYMIVGGTGAAGKYPTIMRNLDGEEVFVVTSYKWGEYLGLIDVVFDSEGRIVEYVGAPIHLDNHTAQDSELQASIEEWREPFEAYAAEVVAFSVDTLDQTSCQDMECTLGDLVADATYAYRVNISEGAAGCILNAGGIRATIDAGNITRGEVLTSFPFGNAVTDVVFTGADLWKIFEGIVSKVNQWNQEEVTSFVQVSSHIRFTYNPHNTIGSRLISLTIGEATVTSTDVREYTIVTWDFIVTGGDNFWPKRTVGATLDSQDEALIQYLQSVGTVNVTLDGRIATTDAASPTNDESVGARMLPMMKTWN
ncbi:Metallo-dependent phosphatase [Hymenopellis radicata]|nr:Metallo-dependent phosphatase [Hymenopellis radicata]